MNRICSDIDQNVLLISYTCNPTNLNTKCCTLNKGDPCPRYLFCVRFPREPVLERQENSQVSAHKIKLSPLLKFPQKNHQRHS